MPKTIVTLLAVILGVGSVALAKGDRIRHRCDPPPLARVDAGPRIQVALLLDTSNSMDGLIGQAQSQLWKIVNAFAGTHRGRRPVRLEVALYEYGNNNLSLANGYVRRVLAFTADLDRVSEDLFALTTNGGDEYCGTVLQASLDELDWSRSRADLKVIFIAGNEPFSQGPVDFRRVCERARQQGVTVNTIHCGAREEGERTGWREGALIARGGFSTIDQDRAVVHVDSPVDAEIARLGIELNKTYVPYGAHGHVGQARQEAQDKNASASGRGSSTSRALTKANRLYSNSGWDLIDAVRNKEVDLGQIKSQDLPVPLQGMNADQKKAFVAEKAKERERVQAEIKRLSAEREKHVAAVRGKTKTSEHSLDSAMTSLLRDQAECLGMELE